jgi:tripartite-type tricarboxylate transporter receptor subunit TctC
MNIMAENTSFLRQAGFLPKLLGATALVFGVAAYGVPAPAADFDAAKHFKGKTIRMIVDFKPGGGTLFCRQLGQVPAWQPADQGQQPVSQSLGPQFRLEVQA